MSKKISKHTKVQSSAARELRAKNDFFFLVVITVFATLVLLTLNFVTQSAKQAARRTTLDLAPLQFASPRPEVVPSPNPPKYKNVVRP